MFNARTPVLSTVLGSLLILFGPMPHEANAQPDEANRWITQLKQGTAAEKIEAADKIADAELPAERSASALLAALNDPDAGVRWHGARAIARLNLRSPAITDRLTELLNSESPVVRIHAARALSATGQQNEAVIKGLVRMVTSADGRVARVGVAALREIKPDRRMVAETLADLLDHDDQAVAIHAVEAIVESGTEAIPFLNEALKSERSGYWAAVAIEQIGAEAAATLPGLMNLVDRTSDVQVRTQGVLAMAALGSAAKQACGQIAELLRADEDSATRAASAYALAVIGCPSSIPSLSAAAKDGDALVSMIATWALAMLQPDDPEMQNRAIEKLVEGLKNDQASIRFVAAKGLNQLDAAAELVAPDLIAAANDPDPSVAANVLDALASLGPAVLQRAVPALQQPDRRAIAVEVIARLGAEAQSAVPDLLDAARSADPEFTARVHHALAEIGVATPEVIAQLKTALASSDEQIRQSAIFSLGHLGSKASEATEPLKRLVQNAAPLDRVAAAWALVQIHPQDREIAQLALPQLMRGLESDDAIVRLESANALGLMGAMSGQTRETLQAVAANDSNPAVRQAAADALEKLK